MISNEMLSLIRKLLPQDINEEYWFKWEVTYDPYKTPDIVIMSIKSGHYYRGRNASLRSAAFKASTSGQVKRIEYNLCGTHELKELQAAAEKAAALLKVTYNSSSDNSSTDNTPEKINV